MKSSKYNIIVRNGDAYILYNSLRDRMMVCALETFKLLESHRENPNALSGIHPELYRCLTDRKFLVPDETDETAELIASIEKSETSDTHFSITINPTMDCNLACWYCYEDHLHDSRMPIEVLNGIRNMLRNICDNGKTRSLSLGFFGGEPLLEFKSRVVPIILEARTLCGEKQIVLNLDFTSNAVLLTRDKADFLHDTGLPVRFQIPFDGGREMHDTVKKMKNGCPTYDLTLDNLKYAVEQGIRVTVRCNYTNQSVASLHGLLDDLLPFFEKHKDSMTFSLHQVWQDERNCEETNDAVRSLEKRINAIVHADPSGVLNDVRCYADRRNAFVVNYNGDLYQCTARKFAPEDREGVLHEDGTIEHNERYRTRMASRFSNPECMECAIYPICKTCTQKRLEREQGRCLWSAEKEQYIEDVVRSRIAELYRLAAVRTAKS